MADSEKRDRVIEKINEYGIYVYIFLMFLAKGEGIRNIIIFGGFALWLSRVKQRQNLPVLKDPLSVVFWVCMAVVPFSVLFSVNQAYSLMELKNEPLKSCLLFPVLATVLAEEERLKRVFVVCFFTAILIVLTGYYSYFFHDLPFLKPDTVLIHAWHNKFARYLCMLLSFSFPLFFVWKRVSLRVVLALFMIASLFALILSTSRGGYAGFLALTAVWSLYLSRKRGYNFLKIIASATVIFLAVVTVFYFSSSDVREGMVRSETGNLFTLNERTVIWVPALHAIAKRPLTGWGYGDLIFHQEEPYRGTDYAEPPFKGPHNSFIKVLFHQGVIGFIPYLVLLAASLAVFWKEALASTGVKSYVLAACTAVLLGNYVVHAMLASPKLVYLAVLVGIGMAAKGVHEDSHP